MRGFFLVIIVAVAWTAGGRAFGARRLRVRGDDRNLQGSGMVIPAKASNGAAFRELAKKFSHKNLKRCQRVGGSDGRNGNIPSMRLLNKYQYRRSHGGERGIPTVEVGQDE